MSKTISALCSTFCIYIYIYRSKIPNVLYFSPNVYNCTNFNHKLKIQGLNIYEKVKCDADIINFDFPLGGT
jgi:hypothetical protein